MQRFDHVARFLLRAWGVLVVDRSGGAHLASPAGSVVTLVQRGCTAIDANATTVVVATDNAGHLTAFDLTGQRLTDWPAMGSRIVELAITPDGRIAIGTRDQRLLVATPDGRVVHEQHLERVPAGSADLWDSCTRGVGALPDGTIVAIAGTGHVHLLDRDHHTRVHVCHQALAYEESVQALAPSASRFALGLISPVAIQGWLPGGPCLGEGCVEHLPVQPPPQTGGDVGEGDRGGRFLLASDRLALVLDADGHTVAAYHFERRSPCARALHEAGRITLLGANGTPRAELDAPRGTRALAVAGELVVVGCTDGTVHWLAGDGTTLDVRQVADRAILGLDAADGMLAVHTGDDRLSFARADAWPAVSHMPVLEPARRLVLEAPGRATWSADGRTIAVQGDPARLVDARDGRELQRFPGANPMDIWPVGDRLVVYFRRQIEVYDAAGATRLGGGEVPPDNLNLRAVLPGGEALLSSVAGMILVRPDGTLHAIDTGAQRRGGVLHHHGNHGPVRADGRRAAVAPTDRRGILLSLPDGAWLAELEPHNGAWQFSPDGTRLLDMRSGALFDAETGAALGSCGAAFGVAIWCGEHVVRCEGDGTWWCDAQGQRLRRLCERGAGQPTASPGGGHLLVRHGAAASVFDGTSGALRGEVALPTRESMRAQFVGETRVIFTPNNTAPTDPTAWLLDPARAALIAPLAVSADGSQHQDGPVVWGDHVALAAVRGPLHVFALSDGALVGRAELAGSLRSLQVGPGGALLAAVAGGELLVFAPG